MSFGTQSQHGWVFKRVRRRTVSIVISLTIAIVVLTRNYIRQALSFPPARFPREQSIHPSRV